MIYELRTYTFPPGKMPVYLKLAEEVGSQVRGDRYGKREGTWITEFGALNQCWHLWSYDSLDERARLRAELSQNEAWMNDFVAKIRPVLAKQEIRFLNLVTDFKPPADDGHVYEIRIYRTQVGVAGKWGQLFKKYLPAREKYSHCVGMWTTEAPQPNEVVHLWAYKDLNSRFKECAGSQGDAEWREFLGQAGPMLEEMQNLVLLPTGYSPMK